MSKYRVKSGLHVVNNQLLRVGEIVEVKSDKFLNAERAPFFEKVVEPEKVKTTVGELGPTCPVGQPGVQGPTGIPGPVGPDDSGAAGASGPASEADAPKKRGPKPKIPAE